MYLWFCGICGSTQETKAKLDETNKKLKQAVTEAETVKKDCHTMIKQYQVSVGSASSVDYGAACRARS